MLVDLLDVSRVKGYRLFKERLKQYDDYISNKRKAHELELEKNKTVASKRLSV